MKTLCRKIFKLFRTAMTILCTITGVTSFVMLACLSSSSEHLFVALLILTCVIVFSGIIIIVCTDPNVVIRHVFAILFCIAAFCARRLNVKNKITIECNRVRRRLDGYPKAYTYALERYDKYAYIDFD